MTRARRGRGTALAASAAVAVALLLALSGGASSAQEGGEGGGGGGGGPIDCALQPNRPECTTTTTVPATTTTFVQTTTTFVQTTTTFISPTTAAVAQETTTSLDVATSQDLLVRGDGTEGAESTTTTTEVPATIADDQADDGPLLALIVGGLVLLSVAVGILTWRYWAATRPPLAPAVGSDRG